MKKQSKKIEKKISNKNIMKTIKITTIILLIMLISIIGFFGIYTQNKNRMSNIIKNYSYSMDINGAREIKLQLSSETSEEIKTEENYKKAKEIIEKRLKTLEVEEYSISLNTNTGEMTIRIPENSNTDTVISNLYTVGKFEIIDSKTEEVLLDNSDIKSSDVLYSTTTSGTTVYLEIAFDKEGKNKLEKITNTYVPVEEDEETDTNNTTEETTNEDASQAETIVDEATEETTEEETENKITMKIDDEEIMSTTFEEPITTGKIQLSVGYASTETDTIEDYIMQAQNYATILDNGNLPVEYNLEKNQYVLSDISQQDLIYIEIAIAVIAFIGIIVLIIKYKTKGLLSGISYIGLIALYLLIIRYTNVIISIESIFGIVTILILNYIFTLMLLDNIEKISKEKDQEIVNKATAETYKKFFIRIIPICIIAITFCFVKWVPISSFGMISFWGLVLIAVYNLVVTRYLLKIK